MSFQFEMALYTCFTREQLEQCLKSMDEEYSPEESDFNLACRIDTAQSYKRPNLVQIRQEQIAENMKYALLKSPADESKKNLDIYPLDILKKLALDMNFFPESVLQSFLWNSFGINLEEKDWDTLAARVQKEEPKVDPVELLRREIQSKILYRLKQLQAFLAIVRQDAESLNKPQGYTGYKPQSNPPSNSSPNSSPNPPFNSSPKGKEKEEN